ncbi:MAG: alpha/beta hydrolase [Flavobacterium sp.]
MKLNFLKSIAFNTKKAGATALIIAMTLVSNNPVYSQNKKTKIKESATTAKTEYALIDNQKMAYRKFGTGAPIIIANRFRGTLDTWDPLFLDLLAKNYTVITFDYAGIGYSEGALPTDIKEVAAEISKLANYLKIDKYNVIGWSYGGLIAQYATFLEPNRVLKTVVIGSNPMGKNAIGIEQSFMERALKPVNDFEDAVVIFYEPKSKESRAAAEASAKRIFAHADVSKIPATQEIFNRYFAIVPQINADTDHFREAYATLKTPVLVISSDHDISFAVENWFPLLRNAPKVQHIILPDSGHGMLFQYPELSTEYITTFLKN